MSNHTNKVTKLKFHERCVCQDVGDLLPDYIVELLSDSAAEEVEEHLAFCRLCREKFLRIVRLQNTAQANSANAGAKDDYEISSAEILRLDDFKKKNHGD